MAARKEIRGAKKRERKTPVFLCTENATRPADRRALHSHRRAAVAWHSSAFSRFFPLHLSLLPVGPRLRGLRSSRFSSSLILIVSSTEHLFLLRPFPQPSQSRVRGMSFIIYRWRLNFIPPSSPGGGPPLRPSSSKLRNDTALFLEKSVSKV